MAILGKSKQQAVAEFRRAEILAAARKVFAEHGYREATLDDIAAAAEIAKGTLYLYFSSKEEIFSAALLGYFAEMLEESGAAIAAASGVEQKLRAAVGVRFDFLRRHEQFLRIYFTEFGSMCAHPGQLQRQFREIYLRGARMLESIIGAGVRSGTIRRVPPLETAMVLMELIRTTVALHLLGMYEHDIDLEPFVFELFWRGIRNDGGRGESAAKNGRGKRRATHDELASAKC